MSEFLWLALLVLFIVAEAATVSVVSTWFAVGSVIALISALLGAKLWLQITLFVVVSAVCLALLRPLVKKTHESSAGTYQCGCVGGKNLSGNDGD